MTTLQPTTPQLEVSLYRMLQAFPGLQGDALRSTFEDLFRNLAAFQRSLAEVINTNVANGNVAGPIGATSGDVVLFDGATGHVIKDGGTLGSAAFTASTAYDTAGAAAAVTPTTLGLVIGTNVEAHSAKLDSVASLASAAGWLHNDGAGVFAYSTPTAAQVGSPSGSGTSSGSNTGDQDLSGLMLSTKLADILALASSYG